MFGTIFDDMIKNVLGDSLRNIIPGISSGELAFKLHCSSPVVKVVGACGGEAGSGHAFYLELLQMTRVCGDINCVLLYEGKNLVVKAVDDIPNYGSPSDVSAFWLYGASGDFRAALQVGTPYEPAPYGRRTIRIVCRIWLESESESFVDPPR